MINVMWFLSLVGSQFYVFASGLPQPAHFVLVLIFISYLFKGNLSFSLLHREAGALRPFVFFLLYTIFVNLCWSLLVQDAGFLRSSVFWIFSFMVLIFVLMGLKYQRTRVCMTYASIIGLILLLLFWAAGVGRYDFGQRYNAFFNDPNQMAFWVLCVFGLFFYATEKRNRYLTLAVMLLAVFLIFITVSRSALLGVLVAAAGSIARFMGVGSESKVSNRLLYVVGALFILPVLAYPLLTSDAASIIIERFSETDFEHQADVRGYSRLFYYPEYFLFGAGQGVDGRLGYTHEIHSSWMALLFYYGVIGIGLFGSFMYVIYSRLDLAEKLVFIAPLLYGVSTYGLRTPVFWLFIGAAMYAGVRNSEKPAEISR